MAVYVGDVNHADVHADVAYVGGGVAIDETVGPTSSEVAVPTVGVAYGDCCDAAGACELAAAAVADGLGGGDFVYLEYGGFEGADVVEGVVVAGVDAVEAKAEAYHVHLSLGEVFDACGVVDVAEDMVCEG